METKVSVIIPAYNAERFLRRSVDSVVAQSFTLWELVIVDDGSTDATPQLADELAANDPRITVVHKRPNAGLAEARRTGIHSSTAPYVLHLDADDWLLPDAISLLYGRCRDRGLDYCAGMPIVYHKENKTKRYRHPFEGEMDGDTFLHMTLNDGNLPNWGCVSRRELWNDDIFPPADMSLPCEDQLLNTGLAKRIKRAGVYNDLTVCAYAINPQSLTSQGTLYQAVRWQRFFEFLRAQLAAQGVLEKYETEVRRLEIDHAAFHLHDLDPKNEWVATVMRHKTKGMPLKHKLESLLLPHPALCRITISAYRKVKSLWTSRL